MTNYPSDLTDSQWQILEKLLCDTRKRRHDLRTIWNALLYLVKTGCQWRMLPSDFAPWSAVYYYFQKWLSDGTFEKVLDFLNMKERTRRNKQETPSLGIIDSQSTKVAHTCSQQVGYDAAKRIKGRKRHIVTDTLGCLILVVVHGADVQDRNGIKHVLPHLKNKFLVGIQKILADGGYSGAAIIEWVKSTLCWELEIVKRSDKNFKILPKRWIVERTLAWISFSRRTSKDYERLTKSSEAITQLAMIRIFIKRY